MTAVRAVLFAALVALGPAPAGAQNKDAPAGAQNSAPADIFISGRMLVAAPRIQDPRFRKTVIVMIRHDADGAFGLIVNRALGSGSLKNFLKGLGRAGGDAGGDLTLHYGGPVQGDVGFVLHSAEFQSETSQPIVPSTDNRTDNGIAWSPAPDALDAASKGQGPKRLLFAFGYAGWGPGQLEGEIERGDWLIAPADSGLIFDLTGEAAWEKARESAGVRL